MRVSQCDGPHCFAVTRAAAGPSCADVLRAMQHEPEVMYEVLKQRTDGATAAAIARAFGAMLYLVFDPEAAVLSSGEGSGMNSDSEVSAAGAAEEEDDEEWEFMRGLTV